VLNGGRTDVVPARELVDSVPELVLAEFVVLKGGATDVVPELAPVLVDVGASVVDVNGSVNVGIGTEIVMPNESAIPSPSSSLSCGVRSTTYIFRVECPREIREETFPFAVNARMA
jgi:hypothetical protein